MSTTRRRSRRPSAPDPAQREPEAALELVRRRENSLLSLFELSHELGVALDPFEIAQLTLFSLMGHFGTPAAALWLRPDEPTNDVVLLRSFGTGDEAARALGARLGRAATAHFSRPSGPVRLADWASAGAPEAQAAIAAGFALLAPVRVQGRLLGFVALGPRLGPEPYSVLDLEYLAAACGMVGVAIENTRLYHRMFEANRQLRDNNERLASLDKLKSEFLQGVNHELRTPIAVIVGYLDVLRHTSALDETGIRAVAIANEQADKLAGMVQNLLDFSEREDALRLEIETRELEPMLRAYTAVRRPGVVNGLREFTLELPQETPRAACDPRRFLQVLDALVDNAIKFTPPGSHVRLRAERRANGDGDWVVIEVEDDGPGISAEHLGILFEPFRQGDGSSTREAGGLGLGLALARRLAEGMGGRLEVKSGPGKGSIFGLWLKAA